MKRTGIFMIIVLLAACLGCGSQEEPKKPVTAKEVKKEAKEAGTTTKEYLAQQQEKYLKQAQEKLGELDKKTSELREKAQKQTGDLKKKLTEEANSLKKQMDAIKTKLAAMKGAGGDAWDKLKSGVDGAMSELEKAYKQAESESK